MGGKGMGAPGGEFDGQKESALMKLYID
jgi:hypothetical protein